MYARFRVDALLPYDSAERTPLFTAAEIDAFVDRFEAPVALRDPFSQQLMRRPVAVRQRDGVVQQMCADESSLRRVLDESGRHYRTGDMSNPLHGARFVLHRPMCWQLHRFYADALERASDQYGPQGERFIAISQYIDAALYEVRQPLMPVLARSEQALLAGEALLPFERGMVVAQRLRSGVDRLLPRIAQPIYPLLDLEQRRQSLLLDLRALRLHLREARQLLWRALVPQAPLTPDFFQDWRQHYATLDEAAATYEETLRVEVPACLAVRAQAQASAAQGRLRRRRAPDEPRENLYNGIVSLDARRN